MAADNADLMSDANLSMVDSDNDYTAAYVAGDISGIWALNENGWINQNILIKIKCKK